MAVVSVHVIFFSLLSDVELMLDFAGELKQMQVPLKSNE